VSYLIERARRSWIIHKEIGIDGMNKIQQAQDMDQWVTRANVATNLVFYKSGG
jgi:hypothetical protein